MLGNVAIETLVGAFPLIGDLFDAVFKANQRNLALLGDTLERDAPLRDPRGVLRLASLLIAATVLRALRRDLAAHGRDLSLGARRFDTAPYPCVESAHVTTRAPRVAPLAPPSRSSSATVLAGRRALVTGGTRGIGRAIALALAAAGAGSDRHLGAAAADADQMAVRARTPSVRATRSSAATSPTRPTSRALRRPRPAARRPTILVNNAAITHDAHLDDALRRRLERRARDQPDRPVPLSPAGARAG